MAQHTPAISLDDIQTTGPKIQAVSAKDWGQADVLVLGTRQEESGAVLVDSPLDAEANEALEDSFKALGVTGKADEAIRTLAPEAANAQTIILTGLGKVEDPAQGTPRLDSTAAGEISTEALRRAAGAAVRAAATVDSIVFALPAGSVERLEAVVQGATISNYSFTTFKSKKQNAEADTAQAEKSETDMRFITSLDDADKVVKNAGVIGSAVHVVRNLVNTPPSHLYPETFADVVEALFTQTQVTTTVWDENQLAEEGFGGILGVGKGSARQPRLVKLEYSPANATGHIALVGKGITFDTGGISLKPAGSMMTMKSDMTGAATVTAVLSALAQLEVPVKVTGWLAMAENMPSSNAAKPSDVFTMYGGKTVEVLNTDAEGRLVMADALVAAVAENPDSVVDIATLTGAQMVALGTRTTGVMGHEVVRGQLVEAAATTGETVWPMPIPEEAAPSLESTTADLKNIGDRFGGMMSAAAFLREFVGETPWAHLDIAGPSFNEGGAYGYTGKEATGVMVRTLVEFISQQASK